MIGALLPKPPLNLPTHCPHITVHIIETSDVAGPLGTTGFADLGCDPVRCAAFEKLVLELGYKVVIHISFGWREEAKRPTKEQARVREAAWKAAFPLLAEKGCLLWDVVRM